jgi:transcription elongation factor Elf1
MSKYIQLIDFKEIKALRITCLKCNAYWSVPIDYKEYNAPVKCVYCETEYPHSAIDQLCKKIQNIQKAFADLKGTIEIELIIEKTA